MLGTKLDNRLVRALREGVQALPDDLPQLGAYLRLIETLLAEKAAEVEPSWALACAAAAEVETLHGLEAAVTERAIVTRAQSLADVGTKLAMWRALADGCGDSEHPTARDRLILSVEADVARLARRAPDRA